MARVEIPEIVIDARGHPVSGASVQVNVRATGSAATVYEAETGVGTRANPLTTTAQGRIEGWLETGSYNLVVTAGVDVYTQAFEAVALGSSVPAPSTGDILIGPNAGVVGTNQAAYAGSHRGTL